MITYKEQYPYDVSEMNVLKKLHEATETLNPHYRPEDYLQYLQQLNGLGNTPDELNTISKYED